jgi:hypothetical protein
LVPVSPVFGVLEHATASAIDTSERENEEKKRVIGRAPK